jgi:NADPH:quinone reductase-like Zn-dependent oxidoreductase
MDILRQGGRLVTLSAPPPEQLTRLATYVDENRLHVAIADTFALANGRAAFESGRKTHRRPGKTVLVVRD